MSYINRNEGHGLGLRMPEVLRAPASIAPASSSQSNAEGARLKPGHGSDSLLTTSIVSRSMEAMEGLLLAELGDSMVELDTSGSGFRPGQRIDVNTATFKDPADRSSDVSGQATSIARHDTLLSMGATPARTAAELKCLLGNSSARLKHGATVLPPSGAPPLSKRETVALEQAKPRARIEVDIVLECNTCVQGEFLKGHVKVRVRRCSKRDKPVHISAGKVCVVGFESIPSSDERHSFYQCVAPLGDITVEGALGRLRRGLPDDQGYAEAREGVHVIPFAMLLPLDSEKGPAKGVINIHSGVTVRYVAIASFKLRHPDTGKRSIAHFYRTVEIWPRLDPAAILSPAARPLQASASKSLFMGGSGRLQLTARVHRLHWVAGQHCQVSVAVTNGTSKTVRELTVALVRTTVTIKSRGQRGERDEDPDGAQTNTMARVVAESTLEMGQRAAKSHASAKGWWTGVPAGGSLKFSHSILLPISALTLTRSKLLEVEYALRVSLSASSISSDVHVVLPIRIINFKSIDPPPTSPLQHGTQTTHGGPDSLSSSSGRSQWTTSTRASDKPSRNPSIMPNKPAVSPSVYDEGKSSEDREETPPAEAVDGRRVSKSHIDPLVRRTVPDAQFVQSFSDLYLSREKSSASGAHRPVDRGSPPSSSASLASINPAQSGRPATDQISPFAQRVLDKMASGRDSLTHDTDQSSQHSSSSSNRMTVQSSCDSWTEDDDPRARFKTKSDFGLSDDDMTPISRSSSTFSFHPSPKPPSRASLVMNRAGDAAPSVNELVTPKVPRHTATPGPGPRTHKQPFTPCQMGRDMRPRPTPKDSIQSSSSVRAKIQALEDKMRAED